MPDLYTQRRLANVIAKRDELLVELIKSPKPAPQRLLAQLDSLRDLIFMLKMVLKYPGLERR